MSTKLLEVIDNALAAALREVRRARARGPLPPLPVLPPPPFRRKSCTSLCKEILLAAGHPLHVSALLLALEAQDKKSSRDALVSALAKQLAPKGPFVRTAPNTFGLALRDSEEVP